MQVDKQFPEAGLGRELNCDATVRGMVHAE